MDFFVETSRSSLCMMLGNISRINVSQYHIVYRCTCKIPLYQFFIKLDSQHNLTVFHCLFCKRIFSFKLVSRHDVFVKQELMITVIAAIISAFNKPSLHFIYFVLDDLLLLRKFCLISKSSFCQLL